MSSIPTGGKLYFLLILKPLDVNFVQKWKKCQIYVIQEKIDSVCIQVHASRIFYDHCRPIVTGLEYQLEASYERKVLEFDEALKTAKSEEKQLEPHHTMGDWASKKFRAWLEVHNFHILEQVIKMYINIYFTRTKTGLQRVWKRKVE